MGWAHSGRHLRGKETFHSLVIEECEGTDSISSYTSTNTHNASGQRQHIPLIRWPTIMPETQQHSSQGIAKSTGLCGKRIWLSILALSPIDIVC